MELDLILQMFIKVLGLQIGKHFQTLSNLRIRICTHIYRARLENTT